MSWVDHWQAAVEILIVNKRHTVDVEQTIYMTGTAQIQVKGALAIGRALGQDGLRLTYV